MKKAQKLTGIVLALIMLISVFMVAPLSASAVDKTATSTRPVITDVVNSDPEIQVATNRYYFYMPDSWYNEKNDNYNGISLESCAAGVYWWSTSYNCDDYKGDNAKGWPGFLILNNLADEGYPNIFYCDVPEDASILIFNNTVDGGKDESSSGWGYNAQTVNINTEYSNPDDDPYGFYEKLDTADNMIYVTNPLDTETKESSGVTTTKGDWFYYYGDGTYGITPEKGDLAFANGDFPSALDISTWNVTGLADKTYTGKALTQKNIVVSKDGENAEINVSYANNKKAGTAFVMITGTGNYTGSILKTFRIYKAKNPMTLGYNKSATAKAKKKTIIKKAIIVKKAQGKVTYKTNNKKVTVKNGTITVSKGLKKGKTYSVKVTITAKGNANYKSVKKTVTVKLKIK